MIRVSKDPEVRRKEFIDIAGELFKERGFEKTSVNDITERVGLSHGSFFYYFKSKNDLMKEIVFDGIDQIREYTEELIKNNEMNALKKVQTILERLIESYTNPDKLVMFCHREDNSALHMEYTRKYRELITPLYTEIVQQGIEEGSFDVEYPAETVEYLTYIWGNMGDVINESLTVGEYNKKIRALEILISKALGIKGEFNIR